MTAFCLDSSIDLWPAIGTQSDVCGHVETMSGAEKTEYSQAIKKAYKISCREGNTPITRVNVMGMRMALSPDQAMFGIVALFGAVGGMLYSFGRLFFARSGETGIAPSLLRPFAASALAVIVYVILRALFLPPGNLASTTPYGFIAIAALTGYSLDFVLTALRPAAIRNRHKTKGS